MEDDSLFPVRSSVELTKREYFATMAMQGMLADSTNRKHFERMAGDAVLAADRLIAALDAKIGEP